MKDTIKRFTSLMLVLIMVLGLLPVGVLATENVSDFTQLTELASESQVDSTPEIQPITDVGADARATFSVGAENYSDLSEAITAAQSGEDKTIVVATGGLLSGSYTIPSGVTLLVPFDDANTLYKETPMATRTAATPREYCKLVLAADAALVVEGAISVGGQYYSAAGSQIGSMVGDYGYLWLNMGATVTVKDGGALYAWGFVSGNGTVAAENGAKVYEWFQIGDFRGGRATMCMANRVFPFSQYFIQNIEAPLTIYSGAEEILYTDIYASDAQNGASVTFIGDSGMFKVVSGSLTKQYDSGEDRMVYTVNGEAELNSLRISSGALNVDSSEYVLPITNNMTLHLMPGSSITVNQDISLLPGVQVYVDRFAELTIAANQKAYIYDSDQWNDQNYVHPNAHFKSVGYSPTKSYFRTEVDLLDAVVDVNGTLIAAGEVYTTVGGANVCSSEGTGTVELPAAPGEETITYQYTQSGSKVTSHDIPITPARLHNADDTYTETAASKAGDTYVYANGKWAIKGNEITITFDPNGGTGSMEAMSVNPGVNNTLTANTFTRADYTFTGWNTAADGTGTAYADQATVNFDTNTTLYAQWTQNPVITFEANGGEGNMGAQTVQPNEATALTASAFTRADYDFAGWNTAADGSGTAYADQAAITTSENVTLYAQWTLHKYHVRWLNWDGSVLQEGDYTCEETAAWDMDNDDPSRPEDENYTYVFLHRWIPYDEAKEINGWGFNPHEDVDFTAVFNKFEKLTVTFDANGGIGTMDSVRIVNGASGEYYTLPECGFTREDYTFNGWLITGTVKMTTWEDEENLNDELWTQPELFAFSNLTLKASWKHKDGWFTDVSGKQYYKDGELQKTGWTVIDGKTYYLDTETGYAATGIATLTPAGATKAARCVFDAEGVFQSDVTGVYSVGADTYWLNSGIIEEEAGLKRVDKGDGEVNYYYFGVDGKAYKATAETREYVVEKNNGYALPEGNRYPFDENGVIVHFAGCPNGIYHDETTGNYYYCVDGVIIANGLMLIDGYYYYARTSTGAFVRNQSYWVSKTNGLLEEGIYNFDNEGRIVFPEEQEKKNGIVSENGSLYYYVDGVLTGAGLIQLNGGYYYVKTSTGEVIHGKSYWVTATNGLMPIGKYTFDSDGKMIDPPTPGPVKDGIVAENGSLYYYIDGVLTGAGLVQIDDDYYYVRTSNGEVIHGRSYWVTATNGLLPAGLYRFADDGKLIK